MRTYEYPHVVGFQETNLVGNVYYVNYLSWQGRCREMFLRDNAPEILDDLANGLHLVTTHVSCQFLSELFAFDEVVIRMRLGTVVQNRITMLFEYWRRTPDGDLLVARGEQGAACMRQEGGSIVPTQIPESLVRALRAYADS
ncbi:MAG: acyl-CoA thioesterase [Chloroflexia bacterium]